MSSATLVSVQEYLAASFDPDRDYVDGELQERNLGEQPHSLTQTSLAAFLFNRRTQWGIRVLTTTRTGRSYAFSRTGCMRAPCVRSSRPHCAAGAFPLHRDTFAGRQSFATQRKTGGLLPNGCPLRVGARSIHAPGILLHAGRDARSPGWNVAHEEPRHRSSHRRSLRGVSQPPRSSARTFSRRSRSASDNPASISGVIRPTESMSMM